MDLALLATFTTVVEEGSFSRAGDKLLRTQPAVSLALKRLESELGEKLIDRSSKQLVLTDAGKVVRDYAQRFDNLERELRNSLLELRDKRAGKLTIGANESTALYLLSHIEHYRGLYPGVKVEIRRSLSSRIPDAVAAGSLDLGAISYDPRNPELASSEIYNDSLTFVVSPKHRFAGRKQVGLSELGMETFIAHNVVSPYRATVIEAFQRHQVPLNMEVENANHRDNPQAGATEHGSGVPAEDVRRAGDSGGDADGGGGQGDPCGAQDQTYFSGQAANLPCRPGVLGSGPPETLTGP